jgi:(1->4)-alpha-D-glucan 1-alpha-D-glucosylmutase
MPERFGIPIEAFHGQNIDRTKFWPGAMVTSSTHDSKRSEDVRARINVLSEIPEEWKKHLILWKRLNRKKRVIVDGQAVPSRNEEYLLYQTLLGTWPATGMDDGAFEDYKNRIRNYMLKAIREAKVNTSWINPNMIYEDAVTCFIDSILAERASNHFLNDFIDLQKKVSVYGMYNSLSQTLLKITSPGVPDFYQGTELWNLFLVDPDNRMSVNYKKRADMIKDLKSQEKEAGLLELSQNLIKNKENGKIKLNLILRALQFRNRNRELFENGEYFPLEATGASAYHVCGFARRLNKAQVLAIAPRFFAQLIPDPDTMPFGKETWKDSYLLVPFADKGEQYRNILTGETCTVQDDLDAAGIYLSDIFSHSPVALLEKLNSI